MYEITKAERKYIKMIKSGYAWRAKLQVSFLFFISFINISEC